MPARPARIADRPSDAPARDGGDAEGAEAGTGGGPGSTSSGTKICCRSYGPRMSAADEAESTPRGRGAHCPTCRAPTAWEGNTHRPFCSLTCRLIDLGRWLDGRYRIDADEAPEAPGPPDVPSRVP